MTVATEVVARKYIDIVADVDIAVPFPLYATSEIKVYYGIASLVAVEGVDYTVLLQPDEFDTFIITPLQALIDKIDALIVLNSDEVNSITVRSAMGYLTSATAAAVRNTPFTAREFDRTIRRLQELREQIARSVVLAPTFVGDNVSPALQLNQLVPGTVLVVNEDGTALEAGPTVEAIQNAEDILNELPGVIAATVLAVLAALPNRPDGDTTGLAVDQWYLNGGAVTRVQP